MNKTTLGLITTLLLMCSCGKDSGKSGGQKASTSTQTSESSTTEVEASDVGTSELPKLLEGKVERFTPYLSDDTANYIKNINTHLLKFKVHSKFTENTEIECIRLVYDRNKNVLKANFDYAGEAEFKVTILDTDPNEVPFQCSLKFDDKEIETRMFTIRKSFVIKGRQDISETSIGDKSKVGTLFLHSSAELYVLTKNIELDVEELISEYGTISNIPDLLTKNPKFDTVGRTGGDITLKIHELRGDMQIMMNGEHGGEVAKTVVDKTFHVAADPAHNGRCGNPKNGRNVGRDQNCLGKNGHPGEKGMNGKNGFPGGDTGKLTLEIENSNDSQIYIWLTPGSGSNGERGGRGSFGSPGGKGVKVSWTTYGGCGREGPCNSTDHYYKYADGQEGPRGPDGDDGKNGADGKIIPAKITFNGVTQETFNNLYLR